MNRSCKCLHVVVLCLGIGTWAVPCPGQEESAGEMDMGGYSCSKEYDQRLATHVFAYFNTVDEGSVLGGASEDIRRKKMEKIPPCNVFVGEALELLYAVTDFKTGDGFLSANAMGDFLESAADKWTYIGNADDQMVLRRAQERANRCHPTIAVYRNRSPGRHGHVSIILPGELRQSWTWGLMVPNSASSFLNRLWESYSGNKLSYAFSADEISGVKIYYRRTAAALPKRRRTYYEPLYPWSVPRTAGP